MSAKVRRPAKPSELASRFRSILGRVHSFVFKGNKRYDSEDIAMLLLELIESIELTVQKVGSIGQWVTAIAFLNAECYRVIDHRPSINTIRTVIYTSNLLKLPGDLEQPGIDWVKGQRKV